MFVLAHTPWNETLASKGSGSEKESLEGHEGDKGHDRRERELHKKGTKSLQTEVWLTYHLTQETSSMNEARGARRNTTAQ